MAKFGELTREALKEITAEPIGTAFGGRGVTLDAFLDALNVLKKNKIPGISPSKVTKLIWAVIKDGNEVSGKGKPIKKKAKAEKPEPEEDDDEEEMEPYTKRQLQKLSNDELKEEADFYELEAPKRLTEKARKELIAEILEAQDEYFSEEDSDEDDDEEEDDEEDEDDDEESDYDKELYTIKELKLMTDKELIELANEFGVEKFWKGKKLNRDDRTIMYEHIREAHMELIDETKAIIEETEKSSKTVKRKIRQKKNERKKNR